MIAWLINVLYNLITLGLLAACWYGYALAPLPHAVATCFFIVVLRKAGFRQNMLTTILVLGVLVGYTILTLALCYALGYGLAVLGLLHVYIFFYVAILGLLLVAHFTLWGLTHYLTTAIFKMPFRYKHFIIFYIIALVFVTAWFLLVDWGDRVNVLRRDKDIESAAWGAFIVLAYVYYRFIRLIAQRPRAQDEELRRKPGLDPLSYEHLKTDDGGWNAPLKQHEL